MLMIEKIMRTALKIMFPRKLENVFHCINQRLLVQNINKSNIDDEFQAY